MPATSDKLIQCDDFDSELRHYTEVLGYRIDSIFPADAPRVATLSLGDACIRLERTGRGEGTPLSTAALIVTGPDEHSFVAGRAGMYYRDLIPGRYGGRFIASHIRIPAGGPVPDYVHHHSVEFQLIFCVNGWVRVAYEDQGEPMVLNPGDCFLQPPHIRHQVLECSDGLEVIEISCPAEHETMADHAMSLSTGKFVPDRTFDGQRFVFFQYKTTGWQVRTDLTDFDYKDLGINVATNGLVAGEILRSTRANGELDLTHRGELAFIYVLLGRATLEAESQTSLTAGHAIAIPPETAASLRNVSDQFELLRISVPTK